MPNLSRMAVPAGAAPLRAVRLGAPDAVLERRPNGTIFIRAPPAAGAYHRTLSEPLEKWAKAAPERVFLAQRDGSGAWRTLAYAQVLT